MSRYIQSLLYGGLVRPAFKAGGVGQVDRLVPIPTLLTANASTTDGTSIATASVSPTANQPIYAAVFAQLAGTPPEPTCTGNGLTWTSVKTLAFSTRRLQIFSAIGANPSAGVITFDYGASSPTAFAWAVIQVAGAATSSFTVQAPTGTTATDTSLAAPTLSAFEHIDNINLSFFTTVANADITPDADFTELADVGAAGNAVRLQVEWARNQTDCTATFASTTAGALSLEVKAG